MKKQQYPWRTNRLIEVDDESYCNERLFNQLEALKKTFSLIDFKCHFDDKGCRKYKHTINAACCCQYCASTTGYLSVVRSSDVAFYKKKWSKYTGFWRKGKGCVLPHEKRSIVCLEYHCAYKDHVFSNWIHSLADILIDLQRKLRENDK